MPVNEDFSGVSTRPPSRMRSVPPRSASSPRRWARPTPCTSTADVARARGYRDVIAPPTFAVLIAQQCDAQLIADPEAGIDFSRVVHGEQRFVHHRPLTAGDDVVGMLHVDAVREAGGHAMVTTRTELATVDGRGGLHRHVHHRHPRRRVMGDDPSPWPSVDGRRDACPGRTVHVERATPGAVRRGVASTATRSTGTSGSPSRSACPTSSPTACSRWARRSPSSPTGSATPAGSSSTACASPSRSSCPTRAAPTSRSSGVVKAVDAETRRATVELTATSSGDKVLGRALAVVQLD